MLAWAIMLSGRATELATHVFGSLSVFSTVYEVPFHEPPHHPALLRACPDCQWLRQTEPFYTLFHSSDNDFTHSIPRSCQACSWRCSRCRARHPI